MRGARLYTIYGVALLAVLAFAEYRGWGLWRPSRVRDVPRSVRENPGVYRSVYVGGRRFPGGK
jgi:hypothetical protein